LWILRRSKQNPRHCTAALPVITAENFMSDRKRRPKTQQTAKTP